MTKLIERITNSFNSKNLCPNVTVFDDSDVCEFSIQFSDGVYIYNFVLYDELGFEEPDFDDFFEGETEYDESEYWEEDSPTIYLNISLEDYDSSMEDIDLCSEDFDVIFPIICEYMKKNNVNYFRPY